MIDKQMVRTYIYDKRVFKVKYNVLSGGGKIIKVFNQNGHSIEPTSEAFLFFKGIIENNKAA